MAPASFQVSLEGLNYKGGGLAQHEHVHHYRLPTSLSGDSKQLWVSSGLTTLPSEVKGFGKEIEIEIVGRLLADLDGFLALGLQLQPYYDRDVTKEDMEPPDRTAYILIGGSHALRTANGLARSGKRAIAATIAGWRPSPDQMKAMLNKISRALDLCPDKGKVVCVLQCYDNSSYYSQDEDGNLVAAKKGADNKYHVLGRSVLAHTDTQYICFKKTLPILEAVKDYRKVILAPLPRYWEERCCSDKSHVMNLEDSDYKSKLEAGIYNYKDNIRASCFRHGVRNVRVIGSWHLIKKEPGIWGDPVHLSEKGYNLLAAGVTEAVDSMEAKRKADTDSTAVQCKRPRFEVTAARCSGRDLATRLGPPVEGQRDLQSDNSGGSRNGPPTGWRSGGRYDGSSNSSRWRGGGRWNGGGSNYKKKY